MPQPRCSVALNFGRGFTLIELLVVVAIIAILAALLFPVAQRVSSAAKGTQCLNNLRTIHGVALRFANENNGQLPTWGDPGQERRWLQAMAPLFDEAQQLPNPMTARGNATVLGQIWNKLACPATDREFCYPGNLASPYFVTYAVSNFHPVNRAPVMLLQVERPAKSIYLVDGWAEVAGQKSRNTDVVDEGWPKKTTNLVHFPHNGRANAIMVDGHVESFEGSIPRRYFWIRDYD